MINAEVAEETDEVVDWSKSEVFFTILVSPKYEIAEFNVLQLF
jgi:hypothetical protein